MEQVRIKVLQKKTGTEAEANVLLPSDLNEALGLLGEKPFLKWARATLLAKARRRLANSTKPRRKILKFALEELSADQKIALIRLGLIKEE